MAWDAFYAPVCVSCFNSGSGPFENFIMLEEERLCGGLFWVAGRGQLAWAHARGPRVHLISLESASVCCTAKIKQTDADTRSETTGFRTKIINSRLPRTQHRALFFLKTHIFMQRYEIKERSLAVRLRNFVCKCAMMVNKKEIWMPPAALYWSKTNTDKAPALTKWNKSLLCPGDNLLLYTE